MPRPKTHDDDLRHRLVDAAARVLAAEGPHALSTRRVAAEVGTSTTAIYNLLGSKQALVQAMYLEGFTRLAERLAEVPRTDAPLHDLGALSAAYLDNAIDNPHLYDVMFGRPVAEFCPSTDDAAYALSTLEVLVHAVERAVAAGALQGEPWDVAVELWAVAHGVASLTVTGMLGSPDDGRRHLRALTDVIMTREAVS